MILNSLVFKNIFLYSIKIFIFLIFLFGRTFMGINFFGFKLGELLMGFTALILIIIFLIFPLIFKKHLFNKKISTAFIILIFSFIFINFKNDVTLLNLTIYKNSSYIWTFGGIAIGFLLSKIHPKIFNKIDIYFSLFGLFLIYIYTTKGISENRQNFLLNFSDKFEYLKGSDVLLALIIILYFVLFKLNFSNSAFNVLLISSALFIPLFLYKSRSSIFSYIIFLTFLLLFFRNKKLQLNRVNKVFFLIAILVFLISTNWVVSKDIVLDSDISEELKYAITNRYSTINDNKYEKEVLELSLFYFKNNRIYTTDGNLNWRFQIWQDVIGDLTSSQQIGLGYGFHEIIPAMNSDQRYGEDQLNIHVHNYLIHILSRGGLLHLGIIFYLYISLYQVFKLKNLERNYLMLTIPILFNSLFDPSMENSHYPIIYFIMLGLIINNDKIFTEELKT